MLDHAGIDVSDYEAAKAFYARALAPLGIELLMEPAPNAAGFGRAEERKPFFWVYDRDEVTTGLHLAFECADRDSVDAFHAAALGAGATDNGAPGPREIYHPGYYGAFVLDADGNNVEAVCHRPPS